MTFRARIRRIVHPLLGKVGLDPSFARDGLRLALQTAVASVAIYLALRAVGLGDQAFVGILSAVYIIQPSIGGTMGAARTRLVATVVGSAIGMACLFGLPSGWGTATALFVTIFVLNGVASLKPEWMYGVVAAVALSLNAEGDLVMVALERCAAIALGAGIGVLATLVVWPDTARQRFERHIDAALRAVRAAISHVTDKAATDHPDRGIEGQDDARDALSNAREALDALKLSEKESPQARVDAAQDVYDGITLLDRVTRRTGDLSGDGPLRDAVTAFRDEVAEVLKSLADKGRPRPDARQRLADARDRVLASENDVELSGIRGLDLAPVLAFAMTQIEDALAALLDAERDAQRTTPAWADRVDSRPARTA